MGHLPQEQRIRYGCFQHEVQHQQKTCRRRDSQPGRLHPYLPAALERPQEPPAARLRTALLAIWVSCLLPAPHLSDAPKHPAVAATLHPFTSGFGDPWTHPRNQSSAVRATRELVPLHRCLISVVHLAYSASAGRSPQAAQEFDLCFSLSPGCAINVRPKDYSKWDSPKPLFQRRTKRSRRRSVARFSRNRHRLHSVARDARLDWSRGSAS
jgi:hypothetical protein